MKYDRNEIVAGTFVLVCILLLLGLIFKAGSFKESLQPKKELMVKFSHARGIKTNNPVYYAGVESGKVAKIEIDEKDNVYLTLELEKGINVKKDSQIKIGASVMGESYIDITPGTGQVMEEGYIAEGIDASIAQQIEDLVSYIKELVESEQITSSLDNLDRALENIADVSDVVANDKDKIGDIISNLDSAMANISRITDSLDENIKEITAKAGEVISNIAEMTDEEQIEKIDKITEDVVEILEENKKSIREITRNIESITDNLYILSADLKRHPWKIIRKSKEQDVEQYALQDAIIRLREAQRNLEELKGKDEKISEEDLEEIRTLIQNLETIKESTQELQTSKQDKSTDRKSLGREPFEKPMLRR
jgi:ABC-type transporter Mla subunit MlaD